MNVGVGRYHYESYPHEVTLMLANGNEILLHITDEDYEVLRNHFIPEDNEKKPTAFPVINTIRPPVQNKFRARGQWADCFVFICLRRDQNNSVRKTQFCIHTKHVLGFQKYGNELI